MKDEEIIGNKYNRLTVIERVEDYISPKGKHCTQYKCLCDCGNITIANPTKLRNGSKVSCGCYQKEQASANRKNSKRCNDYKIYGSYVELYTLNGELILIDYEDFDKVKNILWFIGSKGYARGFSEGHQITLSRLIMNCPSGFRVDHIGGEKTRYDNRKQNLRIVSDSQNNMNKKLSCNNKSGATGVSWNKQSQKWIARIGFNNKRIYLGRFDTMDEAVRARKEAEEKYFGDFSYDNSRRIYDKINLADNNSKNEEVNNIA